jgi:hypothetical protein
MERKTLFPSDGLVMQPFSMENLLQIFLDPRLSGFGLPGRGKIEKIRSPPPRGQRVKSGFQIRKLVELRLQFFGNPEFLTLFEIHFQAGLLNRNGLPDIFFQNAFHGIDLPNIGEANLAGRLDVFRLPEQDPMGVVQQGAFKEQKRAVFFKSVDQNDILILKGVAGNAPLQFFGQRAVKKNAPQLFKFFLPFLRLLQKRINLRIRSVIGHPKTPLSIFPVGRARKSLPVFPAPGFIPLFYYPARKPERYVPAGKNGETRPDYPAF